MNREKFLNWFYPRRKFLDNAFSIVGLLSLYGIGFLYNPFRFLCFFLWFVVFHLFPQAGTYKFLEYICERDGLTGEK